MASGRPKSSASRKSPGRHRGPTVRVLSRKKWSWKLESSWWFQPIWKIWRSNWVHLPQMSEKKMKKYLSCHHLGIYHCYTQSGQTTCAFLEPELFPGIWSPGIPGFLNWGWPKAVWSLQFAQTQWFFGIEQLAHQEWRLDSSKSWHLSWVSGIPLHTDVDVWGNINQTLNFFGPPFQPVTPKTNKVGTQPFTEKRSFHLIFLQEFAACEAPRSHTKLTAAIFSIPNSDHSNHHSGQIWHRLVHLKEDFRGRWRYISPKSFVGSMV